MAAEARYRADLMARVMDAVASGAALWDMKALVGEVDV